MFSNSSSQWMDVDEAPEDHNIVDILDVEPKRRENEASNMIAARRTRSDDDRIIFKMEREENNPDDGFSWKKYGQKFIKGNPNMRRYYKCRFVGCKVKKHVERGADNVKSLVITYYGIHEHNAPSSSSSASQVFSPSLELHLGITGLSTLPSLRE